MLFIHGPMIRISDDGPVIRIHEIKGGEQDRVQLGNIDDLERGARSSRMDISVSGRIGEANGDRYCLFSVLLIKNGMNSIEKQKRMPRLDMFAWTIKSISFRSMTISSSIAY